MRKAIVSMMMACVLTVLFQGHFMLKEAKAYSRRQEEQIESCIKVKNGYFISKNLSLYVGKPDAKAIKANLSAYNECVNKGLIFITKNKTIVEKNDHSLYVQGGNIHKRKHYWWGYRFYLTHNDAKLYLKRMPKISKKMAAIGIVLGLLGGIVGFTTEGIGGFALSMASKICGAMAAYINYVCRKVKAVYKKLPKKRGLKIDFKYSLLVSCSRQ